MIPRLSSEQIDSECLQKGLVAAHIGERRAANYTNETVRGKKKTSTSEMNEIQTDAMSVQRDGCGMIDSRAGQSGFINIGPQIGRHEREPHISAVQTGWQTPKRNG